LKRSGPQLHDTEGWASGRRHERPMKSGLILLVLAFVPLTGVWLMNTYC